MNQSENGEKKIGATWDKSRESVTLANTKAQ